MASEATQARIKAYRLTPRARHALRLVAAGHSPGHVARITGYSASHLSRLTHTPAGTAYMRELEAEQARDLFACSLAACDVEAHE